MTRTKVWKYLVIISYLYIGFRILTYTITNEPLPIPIGIAGFIACLIVAFDKAFDTGVYKHD